MGLSFRPATWSWESTSCILPWTSSNILQNVMVSSREDKQMFQLSLFKTTVISCLNVAGVLAMLNGRTLNWYRPELVIKVGFSVASVSRSTSQYLDCKSMTKNHWAPANASRLHQCKAVLGHLVEPRVVDTKAPVARELLHQQNGGCPQGL